LRTLPLTVIETWTWAMSLSFRVSPIAYLGTHGPDKGVFYDQPQIKQLGTGRAHPDLDGTLVKLELVVALLKHGLGALYQVSRKTGFDVAAQRDGGDGTRRDQQPFRVRGRRESRWRPDRRSASCGRRW
jgi:hypothetical protein